MKKVTKKKILFVIIFVVFGLAISQIPISPIVGSKQSFTPFEFLGPTAGMFLGSWSAALSIFFVKLFSVIIGNQPLDLTTFVRFFPMILAAIYFGIAKSKKLILAVPLICMGLFIAHPEGGKAWFYSFYWLIPVICFFKKERLILNALGSTFTAHAVGSVAFLYAFNLPAPIWTALIPIVFMERMLFSLGIWATYLSLNTVLNKLVVRGRISILESLVNPKYIFSLSFFRFYA